MRHLPGHLLIFAAVVVAIGSAAAEEAGPAYKVGDLVVAINDAQLRVRRDGKIEQSDLVFPGVTMRVGAASGRWLWVSNGVPGWINRDDVIPLDEAIDYFTAKIKRFPTIAKWRYARAVAWTNKGELDIAIADYTELIKLRRLPAFYHVRGICHHAKGEYDKAISDYNEAIRLNPKSARYYNSRAEAWHEKGDFERAIEDSQKAITLSPKLASAYTNRGRAYEARGDVALALADYKKSIELDPNYALAQTHFAWLLATSDDDRHRDGQRAVKLAERACKLTSWEDAHTIGTLAAAYAEAGDFDAALRWEEKAQELYSPAMKEKWAFLLDLYKSGKPYRTGMQP